MTLAALAGDVDPEISVFCSAANRARSLYPGIASLEDLVGLVEDAASLWWMSAPTWMFGPAGGWAEKVSSVPEDASPFAVAVLAAHPNPDRMVGALLAERCPVEVLELAVAGARDPSVDIRRRERVWQTVAQAPAATVEVLSKVVLESGVDAETVTWLLSRADVAESHRLGWASSLFVTQPRVVRRVVFGQRCTAGVLDLLERVSRVESPERDAVRSAIVDSPFVTETLLERIVASDASSIGVRERAETMLANRRF